MSASVRVSTLDERPSAFYKLTHRPNWTVGETFTTGDARTFRISKMMPVDDVEDSIYAAFWMVEPV